MLGLCVMRRRLRPLALRRTGRLRRFLIAVAVLVRESFSLIGDKALLVGVVLVLAGPVLVQTTVRSLLIRELGDWRAKTRGGRSRDAAADRRR